MADPVMPSQPDKSTSLMESRECYSKIRKFFTWVYRIPLSIIKGTWLSFTFGEYSWTISGTGFKSFNSMIFIFFGFCKNCGWHKFVYYFFRFAVSAVSAKLCLRIKSLKPKCMCDDRDDECRSGERLVCLFVWGGTVSSQVNWTAK